MKPLFLCPGDLLKFQQDGTIQSTLTELENIPEAAQDDPQRFLKLIAKLSKGSVLEVSQIYIKPRAKGEQSYITFKIVEGTIATEYNKYVVQNEIIMFKIRIKELKDKIKALKDKTEEKTELTYELNNRQKHLDKLTKKDKKTGFTKLLKINLQDIESWDIELK